MRKHGTASILTADQFAELASYDKYSVIIDYDRSVEEGVKAGNYDWANHDITSEHFPNSRKGVLSVSIELVHFARDISRELALKYFDSTGLRPAELPELLAFAEKYPDVQREFPVNALGSVWRDSGGDRGIPYLDRLASLRGLSLNWNDRYWVDTCRFAAVRK